jgi:hypothetical protein
MNSPKFSVTISARKAPLQGNRSGPGRVFSAGSGVVEAIVARISYEQLRLATPTTSEKTMRAKFR